MTILEFMSNSPITTVLIVLIIGMTIEASIKALRRNDKDEDEE
jgi:hypothetical protein